MSGELKFILRGYRTQVDILHTLAEGYAESDQWDTGLWLKLVAWLHGLLLERNRLIGKFLWNLQQPRDGKRLIEDAKDLVAYVGVAADLER